MEIGLVGTRPNRRVAFGFAFLLTSLCGFASPPLPAADSGVDGFPELLDVAPPHDASVGTAPGAADTEGGAATYRLPIVIPPGRAGMQPAIALNYNSRSGNGIAGMGTSLSGLSSVHRCPQTLEQDGVTRGVKHDASDRLCLDGQRLVAVSGAYGVSNTVYRTEIDTFSRVTQIGTLTGSSACFKVELKSGRILSYGAPVSGTTCTTSTRNARVQPSGAAATLSWLVEREEDRVGNTILYGYTNYGNGEVLVSSIDYTGFSTTAGDRHVIFTYGARPTSASPSVIDNDVSVSYLSGGLTLQSKRLTRIDTWVGTQNVRRYALSYAESGSRSVSQYSGRSLLQGVTECADPGSSVEVCHPATGFFWEDAEVTYTLNQPVIPNLPNFAAMEPAGTPLPSDDPEPVPARYLRTVGDLDGDGGKEVALVLATSSPRIFLMKSQPGGTFSAAVEVTGLGVDAIPSSYVDFDADGRADIVKTKSSDGWVHLLTWKLARGQWSTDPNALFRDVTTDIPTSSTGFPVRYADFDGDGRTDVLYQSNDPVCGSDAQGAKPRLTIYLNRTVGRLVDGAAAHFVRATENAPLCLVRVPSTDNTEMVSRDADFDGDGRADIFIVGAPSPNPQRLVYVGAGASADAVTYTSVSMTSIGLSADEVAPSNSSTEKLVRWMDINGDGLEDFVFAQTGGSGSVGSGQWIVRLNKGGTLSAPIATGNSAGLGTFGNTNSNFPPTGRRFRYSSKIAPIDIDSDGRQELLVPVRIGAMYCSAYTVPSGGQQCPRPPPDDGGPQPANELPLCETVMLCPVDPVTGGEIVHFDGHDYFSAYSADVPGETPLDQSTYVMHPLRFVIGGVNASTGLPTITVQEVQKDIYGDQAGDLYGDGMTDVLASIGCARCEAHADNATPNTPSMLPDGTPVASLVDNIKQFVNENVGIGTSGPRPPEVMHAAVNGVDDWAAWVHVPLALPIPTNSVIPLPVYSLPGSNSYVDARHYYFTSSMPVVVVMTQSTAAAYKEDPTFAAGARSRSFAYEEAMYNRLGRGFQGFRKITETTMVTDDLADRRQQIATTYHQKFPLTGKVQSVTIADPTHPGTPYRKQTFIWRCDRTNRNALCPGDGATPSVPQANTVYAPYLDSDLVEMFDLTAAEAGSSVKYGSIATTNAATTGATASGWDSYGNLKDQIVTTSDSASGMLDAQTVTTHRDYTVDTTGWWLDKLGQQTVTTAITYTASHALPSGATAPSQTATSSYQWNADRTPLSQTVQPGVANQTLTTTYGYPSPSYGLPTSVSISGSQVSPSPRTTQLAYTKDGVSIAADGYFVLQTTNPLGQVTTTEHRPRDGGVSRTIDPNDLKTVATYDGFGRVYRTDFLDANNATLQPSIHTSLTACADGACAGGYGEGAGETYAAWRTTTTQDGHPTSVAWYDKLGRVVKSAQSGFSGMIQTRTEYDVMGAVTRTSTPHYAGGTAYWTTFDQYDRQNRLRQKTAPGAELDAAHGNVRTTYAYSGLKTTIKVRATGVLVICSSSTNLCMDMTRTHDSAGRLLQTTQNLGSTANYASANYWFDGAGNPVAAKDAENNVIKATYDALGRRTQMNDPDAGTWSFTYDGLGELLTQTDARGVQTVHTYDALGRLIQRTATDTTAVAPLPKVIRDTWAFDPTGVNGGIGLLDSAKRQTGASTGALTQIYLETDRYEQNTKRLQTQTQALDGQASPWITSHTYDTYGRALTTTYPSGTVVKRGYTAYGDLNQLADDATGTPYWTATAQDAWGNLIAESYAGGIAGAHASYASTGQVKQKKWASGASVLDQWNYAYDSFGNLIQQERRQNAVVSTEMYAYDGLQRLTDDYTDICQGRFCVSTPYAGIAYSPSGNLAAKHDYTAYQYGANGCGPHGASQVTTPLGLLTYACDANGNVVGDNTLSNGRYDFQNLPWYIERLAGGGLPAGQATYQYGPDGNRFHEATTSQTTWYGAAGFERTVDAQTTDRIELGPVSLTLVGGTATARPNLKDRLGSTVAIGNSNGTLWQTRSYDPFGAIRNGDLSDRPTGKLNLSPPTLRGFTGHEHVDDLRLIHMNGRMYDPALGRFLSVDPVIQFPANSQSLNPYSYILNNPLAGVDSSGYCSEATIKDNNVSCTFTPVGSHIAEVATGTLKSDGSVQWSGGASVVGGKLYGGNTMLSVHIQSNGAMNTTQKGFKEHGALVESSSILSPSSVGGEVTNYSMTSTETTLWTRENLGVMFEAIIPSGIREPPEPVRLGVDPLTGENLDRQAAYVFAGAIIGGYVGSEVLGPAVGRIASWFGRSAGSAEIGAVTNTADKFSRYPKGLMDQMVLDAAKQGKGIKIIENLKDPKFRGMEKWSYTEKSSNGLRSEVHYVRDPKTGELMDFKFKHNVDTGQ